MKINILSKKSACRAMRNQVCWIALYSPFTLLDAEALHSDKGFVWVCLQCVYMLVCINASVLCLLVCYKVSAVNFVQIKLLL